MINNKNTVIAILLACILTMAIGYAVLQQRLNVTGTANVSSEFNIQITGINEFFTNQLAETASLSYTRNSAAFSTNLQAPGDNAIYEVVVENLGNLAGYSSISIGNYENPGLEDTVSFKFYCASKKQMTEEGFDEYNDCLYNTILLNPGEKIYYYIMVEFDMWATSLPERKTFNYTYNFVFSQTDASTVDKIEYLAKRPGDANNYFVNVEWYNNMDSQTIETVTFTNSNIVPEDAIGSFDISNSQNGIIMAWYYDNDNDNLYEVFIGQNGGVIANPDSSMLFSTMTNLTAVNGLEFFDTSNVVDMYAMFAHCENIKNIDLSTFNTTNLSTMTYMFGWSTNLETVDLSSFDTSNVISTAYLFYGNNKLKTVYAGDLWNVSHLNDYDMPTFYGCTSLVGGSGIKYEYPNFNVDMANYETGYLTYKEN